MSCCLPQAMHKRFGLTNCISKKCKIFCVVFVMNNINGIYEDFVTTRLEAANECMSTKSKVIHKCPFQSKVMMEKWDNLKNAASRIWRHPINANMIRKWKEHFKNFLGNFTEMTDKSTEEIIRKQVDIDLRNFTVDVLNSYKNNKIIIRT